MAGNRRFTCQLAGVDFLAVTALLRPRVLTSHRILQSSASLLQSHYTRNSTAPTLHTQFHRPHTTHAVPPPPHYTRSSTTPTLHTQFHRPHTTHAIPPPPEIPMKVPRIPLAFRTVVYGVRFLIRGAVAHSGLRSAQFRGFTITLRRTTVGRTPLDG